MALSFGIKGNDIFNDEFGVGAKAQEHAYTIVSGEFNTEYNSNSVTRDTSRTTIGTSNTDLFAGVHLPDGATVTEIRVYGGGAANTKTWQFTAATIGTLGAYVIGTGFVDGAPELTLQLDGTIDNFKFAYAIRIVNMAIGDELREVIIKYTI